MVVHGEKNHRKGVPAEMAAPAEITSQRTQTSRHPGQPIAMSEKSSNFALAFVGDGFANESLFPGQRL